MKIGCRFTFQAAHRLPNVPDGHKCKRLHGHTYLLDIEIEGPVDPTVGWVLDYAFIDEVVRTTVISFLDHSYLNERIVNPTSEAIVDWIWDRLETTNWGPARLARVRVGENEWSWAERAPYER